MFYLVDASNKLVREHANKVALRKLKRKDPNSDSLRITEGETFKKSLTNEKALAKAAEKAAKEKEAPKQPRERRKKSN